MPFIDAKITKKLCEAQLSDLKSYFGEAISLFPGKSENWLMCSISDNCKIWFQGNDSDDSAFIEVKLFGDVNKMSADKFTAKICEYLSNQLDISPSRVYVRYEGGKFWGWNGSDF